MVNKLLDENLLLTKDAGDLILEQASIIECECPKHLIDLLHKIREFKQYEKSCVNKNDKDKATHEWLYTAATNIDQMVSMTILQLARIEELIDTDNNIVPHKNKKTP